MHFGANTQNERMSCRFSTRPSKSFLHPSLPALCYGADPHRPTRGSLAHQQEVGSSPCRIPAGDGRRRMRLKCFPAFLRRGPSSCQSVLSTLYAASRKHLLTFPPRQGVGGGGAGVGVGGGELVVAVARGNGKTVGPFRHAFI